ncbi:hypothetical protein SD77_2412 [Bacillus badius]|uniref:Mobile element protein n=1 Tax=Bacillus badius TaxID=1455 RepID=A0ABR5AZ02_BACBA|nr:hypothetical protein SD78_2129 [Bacillus badius]KIL79958.1 hypothetical protein SD77_2412 [Bacillus badius]
MNRKISLYTSILILHLFRFKKLIGFLYRIGAIKDRSLLLL